MRYEMRTFRQKKTKFSGVSFFTQTNDVGHDFTQSSNIANSLRKTKHSTGHKPMECNVKTSFLRCLVEPQVLHLNYWNSA